MERNTLHWPCVPDVQSDVTNAIGFMYIYSYVDIGDIIVVIFMLCSACLYVHVFTV